MQDSGDVHFPGEQYDENSIEKRVCKERTLIIRWAWLHGLDKVAPVINLVKAITFAQGGKNHDDRTMGSLQGRGHLAGSH